MAPKGLNLFEHHLWKPLAALGLTNPAFELNSDTLINTWIALGIIALVAITGRMSLRNPYSIQGYLAESFIRSFMNMIYQSLDRFVYRYFAFITALFTFILTCNLLVLIPGLEEPTKDLNTTLALGIISFLYAQKEGIKAHGLREYVKEYFKPFFVLFPLEVLGRLATVISLSFRLFGNIFGGAIINSLWQQAVSGSILWHLIGTFLGINLTIMLFFGIFEGFIQAFVFSILSLTYLTLAVQKEEGLHV